jgi:hypothetical protein
VEKKVPDARRVGGLFAFGPHALPRRRTRVVTKKKIGQRPGSMHIDKRAGKLLADPVSDGEDDELLSTEQVAEWLGYSTQALEIARLRPGKGPPFIRISPRVIRYRREAVRAWLRKREHASTKEYSQ